jgi:hypothetical protein
MGCEPTKVPGSFAIVCSRGNDPKCCVTFCHNRSVANCGYPVERKGVPGTCDSPICDKHRHPVGKDIDWCQGHWDHEQREKV